MWKTGRSRLFWKNVWNQDFPKKHPRVVKLSCEEITVDAPSFFEAIKTGYFSTRWNDDEILYSSKCSCILPPIPTVTLTIEDLFANYSLVFKNVILLLVTSVKCVGFFCEPYTESFPTWFPKKPIHWATINLSDGAKKHHSTRPDILEKNSMDFRRKKLHGKSQSQRHTAVQLELTYPPWDPKPQRSSSGAPKMPCLKWYVSVVATRRVFLSISTPNVGWNEFSIWNQDSFVPWKSGRFVGTSPSGTVKVYGKGKTRNPLFWGEACFIMEGGERLHPSEVVQKTGRFIDMFRSNVTFAILVWWLYSKFQKSLVIIWTLEYPVKFRQLKIWRRLAFKKIEFTMFWKHR